jgi:hypothetical protein
MDIQKAITEITKQIGPPKTRAAHGQWTPMAWIVRGLVERNYGVTDAVKHVLENSGHANTEKAFDSLRAAYYSIRGRDWPAQVETEEKEEGFE